MFVDCAEMLKSFPTAPLFSLVAVFFLGTATAAPTNLTGSWSGAFVKNGDPLPVTLVFNPADGGWNGTFNSDAQQASDIPISAVTLKGPSIHFELRGDESALVFDGALQGEVVSGIFTDGATKGSFHLMHDDRVRPALRTRAVSFANG